MEELAAGTTLFWRAVPVLLRRGERGEERPAELTIRLIAANKKRGHGVLRCFISSEADPAFLHVLEVGEEEYALLRQDQDIRVDFANFPGKLIGLLDKCIACKDEDLPRFQAILHATAPTAPTYAPCGHGPAVLAATPASPAPSAASSFRVVENNDFKQLPHICLAFRPGSDAAVKQFLAFRLGELRSDASALSAELERTQGERSSLQASLGEARRAAATAREQHERLLLEHEADARALEAAVLEAKAKELADLREAGLRERSELDSKHREQLEAVQARAASLDAEARALREQKYGLDARASELSHKLGAAEGSNRALTEEVERLRAAHTALGREKAERDVELGEALTKVAALEDKVAGQRGLVAEQGQRIKEMESSLRQLEARADELKAAAQGHEARAGEAASELARANTALERLGNDLALAREKARRKAAIVGRQEEELAARDRERDEAAGRARGLAADLERALADAEALRKEVADTRGKLEERRAQVASNEQMIRWLNNQITETQLHYSSAAIAGSGVLASRYSYRPPVPPAPSSASGSGAATTPLHGPGAGAATAGAGRPTVSTYRTPVTAGLASSGAGLGSGMAGSTALPGSTGGSTGAGASGAAPKGAFRSSFYTTHFGDRAAALDSSEMSEGGAPPERAGEPEERRGGDDRGAEPPRDGSKDRREGKSRRRSRSRSRERKSSRRDRSRSRERRRRSRSRDRERDRDRDRRRRSRSRDRERDRRRRSRSRSRDRYRRRSSPEGGYSYGGRPRREIDPTINFHDPFAKLRSANQATDPAEIARQMQEQQLRARQLVLQQQALSAVAAASKTQREVYVGNLTAGLVTADMLRQLFNSTMAAAFPDMAEGADPVVTVSVHTEGKYAFVELRTAEMATASLQLNGQVQLLGATLSIGRPSGYVDPGKAAAAAVVAAEALARFQAESAQLRKQSGLVSEEILKAEDTCYLQVDGMITADVLADEGEYNEVLADIHDECSKHGTVLRVVVPRPPIPDQAAQLIGTDGYGKAFVQFLDVEGARKAREAIDGRMFAGSTVQATFMQPQQFMDAIAPPPVPAAADPTAAADPLMAALAAAAAPAPLPTPAAL
ncbi:hypothetical protein ABPG77_005766 [Micractinium sp. CCAP 211/92]